MVVKKNDPTTNAQNPPPLSVKLQKIGAGTIEESSEFAGSLEAQQKVTLQPQTQGRIESILVSSGQRVQQIWSKNTRSLVQLLGC